MSDASMNACRVRCSLRSSRMRSSDRRYPLGPRPAKLPRDRTPPKSLTPPSEPGYGTGYGNPPNGSRPGNPYRPGVPATYGQYESRSPRFSNRPVHRSPSWARGSTPPGRLDSPCDSSISLPVCGSPGDEHNHPAPSRLSVSHFPFPFSRPLPAPHGRCRRPVAGRELSGPPSEWQTVQAGEDAWFGGQCAGFVRQLRGSADRDLQHRPS